MRLVLAMHGHEQSANRSKDAGRHRCAVDPGARTTRRDLALEHQRAMLVLEPTLIQRVEHLAMPCHVEDTFHRRALGTGAHHVGTRTIAQQYRQRTDDDRLAGAGLATQHIER